MAKKVGIKVELDGNFTSSMKKLGATTETSLKKMNAGAKKTAGAFKKLGGSIFSLKGLIAGVGVGLLVKKLTDLTLAQADLQDETIKTARAIGIEVEELTSLRRSAELGGASVGELDNGIKRLSRNIFDASQGIGDGAKAFDALGVAVVDNEGSLRATQDVLLDVADAFKEMDDGTLKNAQSQLLFGKSGGKLINTLNQGSEAIIRQRKEAEALGIVFSKEAAEDAEKFNDALTDLGNSFDGAFRGVTEDLLPKLTPMIKDLTNFIADNQDEFKQFGNSLFNLFNDAIPVIKLVAEGINDTVQGWDELIHRIQTGSFFEDLHDLSVEQAQVTKELKEQEKVLAKMESAGLESPALLETVNKLDSRLFEIKGKIQEITGFDFDEGRPVDGTDTEVDENEKKLERRREFLTQKDELNTEANNKELEATLEFEKQFFLATQDRLMKTATLKSKIATDNIRLSKIASDAELKNDLAVADQSIALTKEVFGENKVATLASIGLSTAKGIMAALGSVPPNPILAGVIGATGLVQAGKASGIKLADGTEFVNGPGTSRSDSVPAMLSVGERVVDAETNAQLGGISNDDLLTAIRGGGTNITINAGAGTDLDALAQAVTNGVERAKALGLEPQI